MIDHKADLFMPILSIIKGNNKNVNVRIELSNNFHQNNTLMEIRETLNKSIENFKFHKSQEIEPIRKELESNIVINQLVFTAEKNMKKAKSKYFFNFNS